MTNLKSIFLLTLFCLQGCMAWTSIDLYKETHYAPKEANSIIPIYYKGEYSENRPYERVGRINGRGNAYSNFDQVKTFMKSKVRKMGVDAIIDMECATTSQRAGNYGEYIKPHCTGIAIKYTDNEETKVKASSVKKDIIFVKSCDDKIKISLPSDIDKVFEGVVTIRNGSNKIASGVIVSPDGYIITAAHVARTFML